MIKKKYILILIVIIAGVLTFKNITGKAETQDIASSPKDLGIPTELIAVEKGNIVEDISYIGTILPKESVMVSPVIGGQIKNIHVEEGDMVKAGDLLAKLEDSQLTASYATGEQKLETLKINDQYLKNEIENFHDTSPLVKKLESATSNYKYMKDESEKYQELYNEGIVSEAEYHKIKQEVDTIHFQMEELKTSIDDTYRKLIHEKNMAESQISEISVSLSELDIKMKDTLVRAPRSGMVKKIYYSTGELAAMGKPFVQIDNHEQVIVKVNITESDLQRIKVGDKAILKAKGLNDPITTTVSKITPDINPNTRIGGLEIGPIQLDKGVDFVSGNSVEVDIIINQAEDKLVIPKSAMRSINGENVVYLYDDGLVSEIKITTGMIVGERVEVIEGLKEEDKIAIKNLSKLYQDAEVYIFKGVDQE